MATVSLVSLTKRYGTITAVDRLGLTVEDGEFVVLMGPSGCGKSTVLRMIAGLEAPTEGSIAIDGVVVDKIGPRDRNVAMVFQNYALYPDMSVYDNVAFGLRVRGTTPHETRRRVHEAAEILSIGDLLRRKPRQLSGGQKQRVALARAIVRRPTVYLMDEPLSNLDAQLRTQTRTELIRLHRQLKATVVYVTHDQTEALSMGQRIVVMNQGRVQQIGTPMTLYQQPVNTFVAAFIGTPGMNLISSNHSSDQQIVLGVRPEDVLLEKASPGGNFGNEGTVDIVEIMGAFSHVTLSTRFGPLVAIVDAAKTPEVGTRLKMRFRRVHKFDASTRSRLEGDAHASLNNEVLQFGGEWSG